MAEMIEMDRDGRLKDLEAFANSSTGSSRRDLVEVGAAQMLKSMDFVYGAQKVAIYRDEVKVLERLKLAAAAAGNDYYYRWSTTNKDGTKGWVEGPSIKLADDLCRIYGNCDLLTISMDLGDSWLFVSRFIDLESGYSRNRPFQQRKGQKTMKTDADRQRDIVYQIGCSKAERNVVVHALRTFADYAFQEAKNAIVDKIGKDIEKWRKQVLDRLAAQGVDKRRVEKVIGRNSEVWLAPDIAGVIAVGKTVADGMATWDESYPPLDSSGQQQTAATTAAKQVDASGDLVDTATGEVTSATEAEGAQQAQDQAASGEQNQNQPEFNDGEPRDEAGYRQYALAWISNLLDADDGAKKWKDEKKLRQKCKVGQAIYDELKKEFDGKIAALTNA
jgi:hypothetical protein